MKIAVVGGCGYIGAHMVRVLVEQGLDVAVLDNLSTGHREAVAAPIVEADLRDPQALDAYFADVRPDAVMHFAAKALVAESVAQPALYYDNNVVGTLRLLQAMQRHGVARLVFSSTCATYGVPTRTPIDESHPQAPINPYGASKWMCERMIADACAAHGLRAVSLRYFNAAGASPDGSVGESHDPETHLIPNALRAAAGSGPPLRVHGRDYPTPDGTCVRDYVHVLDLADAHLRALRYLERNAGAQAFNLGSESGHSVLQVLEAVHRVVGFEVPFEWADRRPGDPPVLVADSSQARRELGWTPRYRQIEEIVETAWRWHRSPRY
ncbi:MAG: UDP-glucose 4-epimerase GalE [Xanthomonadales bacterium PRO6]|nr:UDP-glucose 4-epimerase GalE [Xanthomonadales bacterium PRO6]